MRGNLYWFKVIGAGLAGLVILVVAGSTVWYRMTYHVWPGQAASAVIHWCGRDYENSDPRPQTWTQVSRQAGHSLQTVGYYPPLGVRQRLFTAPSPGSRQSISSLPCAVIVYLRLAPNRYLTYTLEGGP